MESSRVWAAAAQTLVNSKFENQNPKPELVPSSSSPSPSPSRFYIDFKHQ